jgi:sigma-B regulation protein RsbU (phosphoserine phosphatase)
VSKQIPNYLKLVIEAPPSPPKIDEDLIALESVCAAFRSATGYTLEYVSADAPRPPSLMWSAPVDPGVGISPRLFRLLGDGADAKAEPRAEFEPVCGLAAAIGKLWDELLLTRLALWRREAELAAGVPVIEHHDETRQLAARLEAVLRGGAEAVNCQAAALYLLDDATSELKLRSSWGLPIRRLLAEPRPLANQLADLEAMLGHAVVLSDPEMFGLWRVPEECGAAVCVPVSSPTMPLGTLWIFSDEPRDFSSVETNLIEVIAGRLASDLERQMLLAAVRNSPDSSQ